MGSPGEETAVKNDGAAGTPEISRHELGPFATNCYVVSFPGSKECWIVDASFGIAPLIAEVRKRGLAPAALVLTHAHVDHIAGVEAVRRAFPGVPVWIHEAEKEWLTDAELNLSALMGEPVTCGAAERLLKHGEKLTLAGQPWRVLHTPGHSPGGIALVHDASKTALVGDSLFAGSIGRTDFPGSSFEELAASIRTHLYTLPGGTRVLPGHGPETTIAKERAGNPFVRG